MFRKHKKHKKPNRHIHSSDSNAEDSEYGGNGAGIYKKEHINERAFANSMRNEQRSRSFGSLVDMEPDAESATGYDGHQNKKDILHIMEDLSIDDERIVRSEVPPDFFPPPPDSRRGGGQAAASPRHGMYPPPHSNGPVPLGATGNGGRRRR